ncbi:MAG: hypothetical protein ACXVRM_02310, partial [Solirubrobacteraceae bacterium]
MNGFTERQREPSLRGRRAHVRLAVAAAVLTALLAAPASGQAAPVTVSTSAVNVHGYKLTLMAGGETGQTPTLSIQLLRRSHGVTQIYSYTFIRNITLTPAPDLSSATLTAALGRFGSVNMSFGSAGPPQMRALNNCPLVSTNRAGKLTGTFTLKLGGRFFRTITERTLPATLSSGGCTFGGSGGGPLARGVSTQFTASRITRSSSVRYTAALPRSGRVL